MSTVEKISRQRATQIIDFTFEDFKKRINFDSISKEVNCSNFEEYLSFGLKLVNNYNDETRLAINLLDTPDFIEFYKQVGKFAEAYAIGTKDNFKAEMPITLEELPEAIKENKETSKKIEFLHSFSHEELLSEDFKYETKMQLLSDILDDKWVDSNEEIVINEVLSLFGTEEKQNLIEKLKTDSKTLDMLIKKINGENKDEMLAILGEMFIESGFVTDSSVISINNNKDDIVTGKFNKGKMYITHSVPQEGGMRDYRTIPAKEYITDPFCLIQMNYDGRQITLPSLLLANSWSNSLSTPEGVFYNYYKENEVIIKENKDELFEEFVMHYLPSGFLKTLGRPLQIIIMACITIVIGGLLAELEAALAVAGLAMSAIDGGKAIYGIVQANQAKDNAETTHALKKAAKMMADNIAQFTLALVDVIMTVAGYAKGKKKIKNKQITENLLRQSKCSKETLLKYLECVDKSNAKRGNPTNYAEIYKKKGKWPDEVWIPKNEKSLNDSGDFNWDLAKCGGYELDINGNAVKEEYIPKIGEKIDRYGPENGRYVSPINGKPYDFYQRSLPYVEDSRQYYQYEVIGDFSNIEYYVNNCKNFNIKTKIEAYVKQTYKGDWNKLKVYKGKIAEGKEWGASNCGIQYEFPLNIEFLLEIGLLK